MAVRSENPEGQGFSLGRLFGGFQERSLEVREGRTPGSITVRRMDFKNPRETEPYVQFLNDMRNISHFVRPPKTVDQLKDMAKASKGMHFLVGTIIEQVEEEGQKRNVERTVGGGLVDDSAFGEADSGLRLFVVDPEMQGQGLGKRIWLERLLWAFLTPTHDGRHRIEVDFSVVLNEDAMLRVLGAKDPKILRSPVKFLEALNKLKAEKHVSTRMLRLGEKYGGNFLYGKPEEATEVPGFTRPQPTARYEVRLDSFKAAVRKDTQALEMIRNAGLSDFLET